MTKDELKSTYGMPAIVERYGFRPNRAGFISCPFHPKDNDASMKIYSDSYHCFGCGASGDIFTFVQKMDNLSFKDTFLSLGGTYDTPTFQSNLAVYHAKKAQKMRWKKREKMRRTIKLNNDLIDIYRDWVNRAEPFSDTWCDCMNKLQYQLYVHEKLGKEVAD